MSTYDYPKYDIGIRQPDCTTDDKSCTKYSALIQYVINSYEYRTPEVRSVKSSQIFKMKRCLQRAFSIRGDSFIAVTISTACVALLVEAYFRTENEDADTTEKAQFGPSDKCIARCQCNVVRELESFGIVVIPNAILPCTVQLLVFS